MEPIDLNEALRLFVTDLQSRKCSSNTVLAYQTDIKQLIAALAKEGVNHPTAVSRPALDKVKALYEKQGYTGKSISRKLNSYRTFFTFLQKKGVTPEDPTAGIVYPKTELQPPRILSQIEYRALRDAVRDNPRMAAIVEVLLQTGLRISELSNLELGDIKEESLLVRAYESQPTRTVPLNSPAKEALNRYLAERPKSKIDNVFITANGRRFLIRNIREVIKRYLLSANIKSASVNDLRHTFVAHHLAAGVPLPELAKIVGHKRLSTTEKYLKFVKVSSKKPTKLGEL